MAVNKPKKHIRLVGHFASQEYIYPGVVRSRFTEKQRSRNIHGNQILQQLEHIKDQFNIPAEVPLPDGIVKDDAVYVEFVSEWGYQLKVKSLEQDTANPAFQILNIRENKDEDDNVQYNVTVMMTAGGVSTFIKKVEQYLNPQKDSQTGKPANAPLINNISEIKLATLQSFWTDAPEIPFPNENAEVWWEVWFRKTPNDESSIGKVLENLRAIGIELGNSEIEFAEHRVRLVRGTAIQLAQSLMLLDNLAELRKPQETADFLLHKEDNYMEQKEWLEDLVQRTESELAENCVIVCLLDSGVNNKHPLISPFLPDSRLYSYKPDDWGVFDDWPQGGHGTGVASLALYGDLVEAIADPNKIRILHGIESFKILQANANTDPQLYGAVTEYATSFPVVNNPQNPRVFCMTVTDEQLAFKGRPSTWSAAIDKITFGSPAEVGSQQLFIVSGGNVIINSHNEYPDRNYYESIHDPGQSYNALTVGAYTRKDRIDPTTGYSHLAPNGAMAPCNSTSTMWDHQWPLKPDIVMEGGNSSTNGTHTSDHSSLKIITADSEYPRYYFLPFGDTSGAAALAAKMAAEIKTVYPDYWPETIRALIVHSAKWTRAMLHNQLFKNLGERDRINLLRSVGYGVPIIEKAINSASNSLTLIAEREIQPYKLNGRDAAYNEYHLFTLPWPADILQDVLFEQDVKLTLTLSYYIEPNPGSRNKRYANNFQYHSHALDFAVIKPGETLPVFSRRISKAAELPDDERDGTGEEWSIGRVRSRGSIKKDFITMSGADMARRNIIAVYPKGGWYKTRKKLGKAESKVRYSLIVSIETPNTEVDIYTPVQIQIEAPITVQI
jgi:hypothetical protein